MNPVNYVYTIFRTEDTLLFLFMCILFVVVVFVLLSLLFFVCVSLCVLVFGF